MQEEDRLIDLMMKAAGIAPESMGFVSADRPVFKETAGRMEEANKKFKIIIDNFRDGIIEVFYQILECFAQYQPVYSYQSSETGKPEMRTVNFPLEHIRDGLEIELFASNELISQDIRREINLTVYQLVKDFNTGAAGAVQAITSPMVPSDFKAWLIAQYKVSVKLLRRILRTLTSGTPPS